MTVHCGLGSGLGVLVHCAGGSAVGPRDSYDADGGWSACSCVAQTASLRSLVHD